MQRFAPIEDLFKGRHFDGQIIILCVAWYTSFKLSLRDLVIMMADRGISVTHTTILLRWVQHYLPEFEKRWWRYARPVGGSWRMDETYIKVHGEWVYLYRAVDKAGQTVDFFLSQNRDVNAAKSFLRSATKNTRVPTKITLDTYAASHRAVREMKEDGELPRRVKVHSSQYLNNLAEQNHRRVKQRIRPMLGFKQFDNAAVTISGIELAEKIKKGQYKTGKLGGRKTTISELWNAALAAEPIAVHSAKQSPTDLLAGMSLHRALGAVLRIKRRVSMLGNWRKEDSSQSLLTLPTMVKAWANRASWRTLTSERKISAG
jgi:transposase-like protein